MDNMSALLVVFDGAPKKQEGFVLYDYSQDQPPAPKRPAAAAGPGAGAGSAPAGPSAGGPPNPMLQMLMVRH